MKPPTTISELRHFVGMVNQLGKFTPNLAQLTQPLRELLGKNTTWVWGPSHLSRKSCPSLPLYDPKTPTKVSILLLPRSSSHTKTESKWRPVAYASRSMTDTEQWYAQIEKKGLAITKGHMDQAIDNWQLHIYKLGFY